MWENSTELIIPAIKLPLAQGLEVSGNICSFVDCGDELSCVDCMIGFRDAMGEAGYTLPVLIKTVNGYQKIGSVEKMG